jgi:hypothetical protein
MRCVRGVSAVVTAIALVAAVTGVSPEVFAAGTATLSLSPAGGSPKKGSTLSVTVNEDSGSDAVNAVQANLSYSTAQLHYVSFSNAPAFTVEAEDPSGDTGSLRFARGVLNGNNNQVTGTQSVVTVNFTVLASSGTVHVNFAGGSAVLRSIDSGAETLATNGGSYTVSASATTAPKSSANTTAPKTTATLASPLAYAMSPQPASTKNKTAGTLSIGNLQVSGDTAAKNTIFTWVTNEPATSIIAYGVDSRHLVVQTDGKLVTSHKVTINSSFLQSGGNYYYYASSTDSAGNKISSQLLPFVAAGGTSVSTNRMINAPSAARFAILGILGVIVIIIVVAMFRKAGSSIESGHELAHHFPDIPVTPMPSEEHTVHPQVPKEPPKGPAGPTVISPSNTQDHPSEPPEMKK